MQTISYGLPLVVFAFLLVLGAFMAYLWSIVWAYEDAESRGKSGLLVALLVMLAVWPIGLIVWLMLRPRDKHPLPRGEAGSG